MRSTVCSKVMFSSCSPSSAFAAGVKIGSSRREASVRPSGSVMPHTDPDSRYSARPEPVR